MALLASLTATMTPTFATSRRLTATVIVNKTGKRVITSRNKTLVRTESTLGF